MNRRDFLKTVGAAGIGVAAGSLAKASEIGASESVESPVAQDRKSAAGLVAPKMDKVRAAFIGVGARGPGHVANCLKIDGVEIKAICDPHIPSANNAVTMVVKAGRPKPDVYTNGDLDYKKMLDRNDIDVVFISTPWEWHVRMCVDTMKAGKHAFVEVPAAYTVDGCWELVETSEQTQKHCMMMENVNYGREELMVLNMCRAGLFGELLHGEAAYIHDLRWQMNEIEHGTGSWRTLHYTKRNGNLYPTHGLGPVAQYMNINRGDRLDFLCSVSSPSRTRAMFAEEHFPEGHERRKLKFVCGDINTTIAKTVLGKTLMIQWDEELPRPYTRHNFIQGTRGCWGGFPNRIVVEKNPKVAGMTTKSTDDWAEGTELDEWYSKYEHPLWKKIGELAKGGGHGGMDFVMMWRIIYCLRNGEPLDQDVYDAATWSVISPLSENSVKNRGKSVDVPDFTRGQWKTLKPLGIVS